MEPHTQGSVCTDLNKVHSFTSPEGGGYFIWYLSPEVRRFDKTASLDFIYLFYACCRLHHTSTNKLFFLCVCVYNVMVRPFSYSYYKGTRDELRKLQLFGNCTFKFRRLSLFYFYLFLFFFHAFCPHSSLKALTLTWLHWKKKQQPVHLSPISRPL